MARFSDLAANPQLASLLTQSNQHTPTQGCRSPNDQVRLRQLLRQLLAVPLRQAAGHHHLFHTPLLLHARRLDNRLRDSRPFAQLSADASSKSCPCSRAGSCRGGGGTKQRQQPQQQPRTSIDSSFASSTNPHVLMTMASACSMNTWAFTQVCNRRQFARRHPPQPRPPPCPPPCAPPPARR